MSPLRQNSLLYTDKSCARTGAQSALIHAKDCGVHRGVKYTICAEMSSLRIDDVSGAEALVE